MPRPPRNPVRAAMWHLIHFTFREVVVFDAMILGCILVNCVQMALQDPSIPEDEVPEVFTNIDFVLMIIFATEAVTRDQFEPDKSVHASEPNTLPLTHYTDGSVRFIKSFRIESNRIESNGIEG